MLDLDGPFGLQRSRERGRERIDDLQLIFARALHLLALCTARNVMVWLQTLHSDVRCGVHTCTAVTFAGLVLTCTGMTMILD